MSGTRLALVAVVAAVFAVAATSVSSASAGASAAPDCSTATATQLINANDLNGFALPDPVVQLLCGPFTGPGTQAMAVTIGAGTCWSPQSWAVFEVKGDTWQLVQHEPAFLAAPLVIVGTDIHETTPIFRAGDPRCVPSGGLHSRVWHWNGSKYVPGAYSGEGKARRTSATFYSPSRNISCEMNDARPHVGTYVYCQSRAHAHSVRMGLGGRLKICRSAASSTAQCLGDPGEHTPVLRYGHQVRLRHFRCRSGHAGVTCVVIKSGRGFRIDRGGVHRVHA